MGGYRTESASSTFVWGSLSKPIRASLTCEKYLRATQNLRVFPHLPSGNVCTFAPPCDDDDDDDDNDAVLKVWQWAISKLL